MTRVDDVINVAGHRLSTGQIEEVLGSHNDVAECAVIGVADELKGQVPLGFLVLKAGVNRPSAGDRQRSGRRWCATASARSPSSRRALVVQRLPKTRSGKILRGTMQKMADSQPWTMPATIEDPAVLDEINDGLKTAGFAAKGWSIASDPRASLVTSRRKPHADREIQPFGDHVDTAVGALQMDLAPRDARIMKRAINSPN